MFDDLKPHIADLRKRLVISSITVVIMFFACFSFYEPILEWMMAPVKHALPAGTSMIAVEIQETFFYSYESCIFWRIYYLFTCNFLAIMVVFSSWFVRP